MTSAPKWRADIAGNVAAIKADAVASFRGEIAQADFFVMAPEDCTHTMDEYGVYLTQAELAACFKRARA